MNVIIFALTSSYADEKPNGGPKDPPFRYQAFGPPLPMSENRKTKRETTDPPFRYQDFASPFVDFHLRGSVMLCERKWFNE